MANNAPAESLHSVLRLLEVQSLRAVGDQELLQRFVARNDEAAFRVLAERHGPMVLGVCSRALRNPHDAEDAFQATFLVFSQRAAAIRKSASLGSWLHGVARRVATRLQRDQRRRQSREQLSQPATGAPPDHELTWAEVKAGLDEELEQLPAAYRDVLVLCYLEGQTRDEAAQRLGVELGVVKGRLERGRRLLAGRLTRRGLSLSAGMLAVAVSPGTLSATVRAAAILAASGPAETAVSPGVLSLAHAVLKGMVMSKVKLIGASLFGSLFLAAGVGLGVAQTPAGVPKDSAVAPATGPESARAKKDDGVPAAVRAGLRWLGQQPVQVHGRAAETDFLLYQDSVETQDTDEAFIRRLSLDLRGILPSETEIHFFARCKDADKRAKLTDLFIKERGEKRGSTTQLQQGTYKLILGLVEQAPSTPKQELLATRVELARLMVKEVELRLRTAREENRGTRELALLEIELDRAKLHLREAELNLDSLKKGDLAPVEVGPARPAPPSKN